MAVVPSRMQPGSMTVSVAIVTVSSTCDDVGSWNVTPASMSRSRMRARRIASVAASSTRVFTPTPSLGSGVQCAATVFPSPTATATRSVRKTSPVSFGASFAMAARSHARSIA